MTYLPPRKLFWPAVVALALLQLGAPKPWASASDIPENIRFRHILVGERLDEAESINAITDIAQDGEGYIWFAGENGLARYNGVFAEVFQSRADDPTTLSGNFVSDLVVDGEGLLWAATAHGLSRYDQATGSFIRYTQTHSGPGVEPGQGLPEDVLLAITVAPDNTLWLGSTRGLIRFGPERRRFEFEDGVLGDVQIRTLSVDSRNRLWVGTTEDGLFAIDLDTGQLRHWAAQPADPQALPHPHVTAVEEDAEGNIWVGTLGAGIAQFNEQENRFRRFQHQRDDPASLPGNAVWDIHVDKAGLLWVATDPTGMALLLPDGESFRRFVHTPYSATSLSSAKVRKVMHDALGNIWVGVFPSGVNYFDKSSLAFTSYFSIPNQPDSLSNDAVTSFYGGEDGTLWVGTEDGLNAFDPARQRFRRYMHDPNDPTSLQGRAVLAMAEDPSGDLWVATWASGLQRLNRATGRFRQYPVNPDDPNSLADAFIWSALRDSENRVWFGSEYTGLYLYRPQTDDFRVFRSVLDSPDALSNPAVWALAEGKDGSIWAGTLHGLNRLDNISEHGVRYTQYFHEPDNPESLSGNRIISLLVDSDGFIWAGTSDAGLNRLHPQTGKVQRYGLAEGLPSQNISSIIEDSKGHIWVTTANGVADINPDNGEVEIYTVADGLAGNSFIRDATFMDAEGKLYFGGIEGLSVFNPDYEQPVSMPPPVVIDQFRLFNKPVHAGDGSGILDKSINHTDHVVLSHEHTMFAFDFYALSYRASHRNQYAYRLDGFDKSWNYVGNNTSATYTNIDPGTYTFQVRAANSDGVWNETGRSVTITIKPSPWASWWAWLCYALAFLALVAFVIQNQRKKMALAQQQALNEKLLKLDQLKDAFLANTSHELRTPLNGIIGLAESMMDSLKGEANKAIRYNLKMIAYSGRRLSNLINDILDHAKLNENKLELHPKPVNLHSACELVVRLNEPLIGNKSLRLINEVDKSAVVRADENRLQQILHNLVGNAVKFTQEGFIKLSAESHKDHWIIRVEDTGRGITAEQAEQVFNAFTQIDSLETRESGGTGLGLAITRQLVQLHGGEIQVYSNPGTGSVFEFTLPRVAMAVGDIAAQNAEPGVMPEVAEPLPEQAGTDTRDAIEALSLYEPQDGDTILVVDDDAVNRMVIHSMLKLHKYHVIEAEDGQRALEIIDAGTKVDLIILDVMMPRISGYEVCMRIRAEHPIDRLPILFLTAKNFGDDLIRGYVSGANSYLAKPVDKHQLLTRVLRHLTAAKTNIKLQNQLASTESRNRAHLLGLDAMEGLLTALNGGFSNERLLGLVAHYILHVTQGQQACYWQYQEASFSYDVLYRFSHDGELKNTSEPVVHLLYDDINECQTNIFTEFEQANCNGALKMMLNHHPDFVHAFILPVEYEKKPVGVFMFTYAPGQEQVTQIAESLNRLKTHVVAAVVKAAGKS